MSPHLLGAELNAYYPDKTGLRQQLVAWRQSLALGKVDDIPIDSLLSATLYNHVRKQLDRQVDGVFRSHYGQQEYDLAMKLRKNAAQFSAHKSAYFTEWMRGKSTKEQEPIRRILLAQLTVEENLASRTSRAARQWQTLIKDRDQYANLEYLPSRSVAKRENHTRYYGLILPIGHSFWNTGLPPNGWNCKCRVRATDKRPVKVMTAPKPVKGIVGNAGKEQVIFASDHPFFSNVNTSASGQIEKEWRKLERNRVRQWARKNVQGKAFRSSEGMIHVNGRGIKEILDQPHDQYWEKNELIFSLKQVIEKAELVRTASWNSEKKSRFFRQVHYFKISINEMDSFLNVRERLDGGLELHSITDKLKEASG